VPGLTTIDTDYGKKIDTDLTWCVNDGACERVTMSNDFGEGIKPCPSFEQGDGDPTEATSIHAAAHGAFDKLPEPTQIKPLKVAGDLWRVHMAGVGGMGIGVVGSILVRAGHKEGYKFSSRTRRVWPSATAACTGRSRS